eukprot:g7350.t1
MKARGVAVLGACAASVIGHATSGAPGRIRQLEKKQPVLQLRRAQEAAGGPPGFLPFLELPFLGLPFLGLPFLECKLNSSLKYSSRSNISFGGITTANGGQSAQFGATGVPPPGVLAKIKNEVEVGISSDAKEDLRKATNIPPGISEVFALRGDELLSCSGVFKLEHMREPTHGNVHYVDEEELLYKKLPATKLREGINPFLATWALGKLILDGEWQDHGYAHGQQHGYKSFRFVSNTQFGPGSVILWDAERIPVGQGTWPAYWSVDAQGIWPNGGEIDMQEGINMHTYMHSTLHTGDRFVRNPTCIT